MRRFTWLAFFAAVLLIVVGCAGEPTALPLPTATPAPTQPIPTPTPTSTPPPTVTPFPTITPRPEETATPVDSEDNSDGDATDRTRRQEATDEAAATDDNVNNPPPPPPPTEELPANAPEDAVGPLPLFTAGFEAGWPDIDQNTVKIEMKNGVYTFEVGPFDGASIATTQIDESRPIYHRRSHSR